MPDRFIKRKTTEEVFTINFADCLATGESLTSISSIKIEWWDRDDWVDVSVDFGNLVANATLSDPYLSIVVPGTALSNEQQYTGPKKYRPRYRVYAVCNTNLGHEAESFAPLEILE